MKCTCPVGGPGRVWGLHRKDCPMRIHILKQRGKK